MGSLPPCISTIIIIIMLKESIAAETNSAWEYQCEIGPNTTEVIWAIGNQSNILSRCSIGSQSCDQRFDCVNATINGTSSFLYIDDIFVKENAEIVGYAEMINNVKGDIRFDAKNRSVNFLCKPSQTESEVHITTAVSEISMLNTETPATTSEASTTSTELTTMTWRTSITISETYTSSGEVSAATSKASAISNELSTDTSKSIATTSDSLTNITETSATTSEASTTSTELTTRNWETSIIISETYTASGKVSTDTSKSITTTRETPSNITETSTTTSKESPVASEGTTTASDTFNATKVSTTTTEKYTVSDESSQTSSSNMPSEAVAIVNITTEPSTKKISTTSNKSVTTSDHSTQSIHSQDSSGGDSTGVIAGSVVGIIALCLIVAVIFVLYKRRQKKNTSFPPVDRNSPDVAVVVDCVNPVYQTSEKSPDASLPPAADTQNSNCDVSQPEGAKTDFTDEIALYAATSTIPSTTTPSSKKEPDKPAMFSTGAYMHSSATTEPAVDVYAVADKPKKNNNFTDHAQPLFGKNVDVVANVSDELYAVPDKCGKPPENRSQAPRSSDEDSKDKGPLDTLNTSLFSDDHSDETTDDRFNEMLSGDVYSKVNKQKQIPESSSSPTQSKF